MKINWIFIGFGLLISGCAGMDVDMGSTGMERTVTTREESGRSTTRREPYPEPRRPGASRDEDRQGEYLERRREMDSAKRFPGPEVSSEPSLEPVEVSTQTRASFGGGGGSPLFTRSGPFFNVMRLRMWTKLTTKFTSASFSNLSWRDSPRLSAPGWETGYLWTDEDGFGSLFVRFSHFEDELTLNDQSAGTMTVREKVLLKGGYLDAGVEVLPLEWLKGEISIGAFNYHLRTTVWTNAPAYTYEGLLGNRTVGIIGLGGGLETPWEFPIRFYAGGRLYFPFNPFNSDEELLETVFGQGNVGVKWTF